MRAGSPLACFVPYWLNIDYRKGEGLGKFGYTHTQAA